MIWSHLEPSQFTGNRRPLSDTKVDPGGCRPGLCGCWCVCWEGRGRGVRVQAVSHLINIKAGEAINKWWGVVYMYFLAAPPCDVRQLPHTQVSWQRAKSRALPCNFELDPPIATSQRRRAGERCWVEKCGGLCETRGKKSEGKVKEKTCRWPTTSGSCGRCLSLCRVGEWKWVFNVGEPDQIKKKVSQGFPEVSSCTCCSRNNVRIKHYQIRIWKCYISIHNKQVCCLTLISIDRWLKENAWKSNTEIWKHAEEINTIKSRNKHLHSTSR